MWLESSLCRLLSCARPLSKITYVYDVDVLCGALCFVTFVYGQYSYPNFCCIVIVILNRVQVR